MALLVASNNIEIPIAFIGSHVQALPGKTVKDEKNIDFVFTNEGVYSLRNVLQLKKINKENLKEIKGLCFLLDKKVIFTPPEKIVPQEKMDDDLPGYAWDLLPFKSNQQPGFGWSAFIFAMIFFALSFQLILASNLSIFFAYVASL